MKRPRIALCWLAGCGGCEQSVLDLHEELLALHRDVEVAFWPIATDARWEDVEAMADGELDACFVNGAVVNEEDRARALLLRRKAARVFAHGACAHLGGVPGLANLTGRAAVLDLVYRELDTVRNPGRVVPAPLAVTASPGEARDEMPLVLPLDRVVRVDAYLPGCPPPASLVGEVVGRLLAGECPGGGAVWGGKTALCGTCPRRGASAEVPPLAAVRRHHLVATPEGRCFLADGVLCMGPATRGGCGERCVGAGIPCRGCFGPPEGVADQGAAAVDFVAALVRNDDLGCALEALEAIDDPEGLFYRFGLASSTLGRTR